MCLRAYGGIDGGLRLANRAGCRRRAWSLVRAVEDSPRAWLRSPPCLVRIHDGGTSTTGRRGLFTSAPPAANSLVRLARNHPGLEKLPEGAMESETRFAGSFEVMTSARTASILIELPHVPNCACLIRDVDMATIQPVQRPVQQDVEVCLRALRHAANSLVRLARKPSWT